MARSVAAALSALLLATLLCFPCLATDKAMPAAVTAPSWAQLTPQQQQVLGELQSQWEQQPAKLRNNLVKVADKYPKMKPEEQERVRRRITHWASLTPEQRQAARKRYKQIKKQPVEKQKEVKQKWESYQLQKSQQGAIPQSTIKTPASAAPLSPAPASTLVPAPTSTPAPTKPK